MKTSFNVLIAASLAAASASAQTPNPKWEELTAGDYLQELKQAQGVCLLPFGLIDAHGPAGPLGTDVYNLRAAALEAVKNEFALVFPTYYFGQAFLGQMKPGTVSYSRRAQLVMLNETTSEMARNGCSKIVVIAGGDSNLTLIRFWVQVFLAKPVKDYMVYAILPVGDRVAGAGTPRAGAIPELPAAARASGPNVDGHGGEDEISVLLAVQPDLAHPERAAQSSGADTGRVTSLGPTVNTAVASYARFPENYSGDASKANVARGQALLRARVESIVTALKAVKADTTGFALQKEFFDEISHPVDTKQ
jgi:creatinine amidohydrolase